MSDTDERSGASPAELADLIEVLIAGGVTRATFHANGRPKTLELSGAGTDALASRVEEAEPEDTNGTRKRALLTLTGRRASQ